MIAEQLLGNVNLFASCSKGELRRIAALGSERKVPAGTVLMEEGAPADGFVVVAEGLVSITAHGKELGSVGPGTSVGETALLDGGPRTATATAVLPTRLIAFEGRVLDELVDTVPSVAKRLLRQTSRRLRAADALATVEPVTAS